MGERVEPDGTVAIGPRSGESYWYRQAILRVIDEAVQVHLGAAADYDAGARHMAFKLRARFEEEP